MPLRLVPPNLKRRCPYYTVRGTYLGLRMDRSTKTGSRSVATKLLQAWRSDIERDAISRPGEPTFLDACVAYVAVHGEQRFLPRVTEELGTTPLRQIDQHAIDTLAAKLYPEGSAATRNRQVYTPVSAVLKHSKIEWELRRPKGWRGAMTTAWYQPAQAFLIFEVAAKVDKEFGIFLQFLTYTGARLTEATARLRCDSLSLKDRLGYIDLGKNREPRAVFLPPQLVAALANHPSGLDRAGRTVFRFRKNGHLYKMLKKVRTALAGQVTVGGFHVFCHTYATWMRRYAGLDTSGLVATTRWKDPASARRYEHLVASEEAMKAVLLPTPDGLSRDSRRKAKRNAA